MLAGILLRWAIFVNKKQKTFERMGTQMNQPLLVKQDKENAIYLVKNKQLAKQLWIWHKENY